MGKKNKSNFVQQEQKPEVQQEQVQEEVVAEQKEEVKPESVQAKQEEVKVQEPAKVIKEDIQLSDDEEAKVVTKIMSDSKLDNVAKFEAICESNTKYALLAKNLKSYQDKMGSGSPIPKAVDGAANNYNLYVALLGIVNTPIYTEFKIKFDIVNLCFLAYANDAYSEFKLFRFSIDWKYGKDKYVTYRSLAILICMLCDKVTRAEALKKIVLSKALTLDGTKFTETSIQNVKRYYES